MTRIQMRRDTAALWTSNNPILSSGELGFETDTNKFKIGDGDSHWNSLNYFSHELSAINIIDMINASASLIDDNNIASTIARDSEVTAAISQAIASLVNTNDSRLSDARTPLSHTHTANNTIDFDETVSMNVTVSSSALHIINTSNPHSVTASQIGLGNVTNDAQLKSAQLVTTVIDDDTKVPSAGSIVDYVTWDNTSSKPTTFTPASHTHGNITNVGAIGSVSSLPIITTTNGVLTTGSFGTGSTNFCVGNDSRLSDSRTPLTHTHTYSDISSFVTSITNDDTKIPSAGAVYTYANNIVTYETLFSNGDIGSGSTQVASGSHIHDTIDGGSPADYTYININGGTA